VPVADRGRATRSWAASRLPSSEAATPRLTVAVGVASDRPPAATDVASSPFLRGRCQRHRGFYPGEVLVTLRLKSYLTASRGRLQGMDVVRLLIVLAQLGADVSRSADARRIVDRSHKGESGQLSYAWDGH
jgi:hypothetical protein